MSCRPTAVLISDVHYNLQTLPLADASMRMAIDKANSLSIPLIVAGDLHDTKANLRGECVNAMIDTFQYADKLGVFCYVLRGNHDSLNEKSKDSAIKFLEVPAAVIEEPFFISELTLYAIPYQHSPENLIVYISKLPEGSTIIMHQGISGSKSGEYIQDKSAISGEYLENLRIISGHYHTRQDIKCGRLRKGHVGLASYIGNPYTLNYAEADDPEKGFQILHSDGSLEFIPTNLRRHRVYELQANDWKGCLVGVKEDLIWLKISGTKEQLSTINKAAVLEHYHYFGNIRLDLIPTDSVNRVEHKNQTQSELLDSTIDSLTATTDETKLRLKSLWRGFV